MDIFTRQETHFSCIPCIAKIFILIRTCSGSVAMIMIHKIVQFLSSLHHNCTDIIIVFGCYFVSHSHAVPGIMCLKWTEWSKIRHFSSMALPLQVDYKKKKKCATRTTFTWKCIGTLIKRKKTIPINIWNNLLRQRITIKIKKIGRVSGFSWNGWNHRT